MKFLFAALTLISFNLAVAQSGFKNEKEQTAKLDEELKQAQAAVRPSGPTEVSVTPSANLHGRDFYFDAGNVLTLVLGDKYKSDSSSADRSRQSVAVDFGWNWGQFEFGPTLSFDHYDAESFKKTSSSIGGSFAFNFIPNQPGNDFVPFVNLGLSYYDYDYKNVSTSYSSYGENGTQFELGGGVKYFPFGEYLALVAKAYYRFCDGSYNSTDYTSRSIGLRGSLLIYF